MNLTSLTRIASYSTLFLVPGQKWCQNSGAVFVLAPVRARQEPAALTNDSSTMVAGKGDKIG